MDRLGLPASNVLAYTMPGFATPSTRKGNVCAADGSARRQRAGDRHPPVRDADAARPGPPRGRGEPQYDVTFENVQAGERTSHLFRLANHNGAIVVGTGDLSELALGWSTYGVGDACSQYVFTADRCESVVSRWTSGCSGAMTM